MMNFEALVRVMDEWDENTPVPRGLIVDESSRCKGATSQRTQAVQKLADMVRDTHGFEGYVIEMSGTPSPKSPLDWWAQSEIAWPGFLKEGSIKAMEQRLAFLKQQKFDAGTFNKRIGWKDDERKCKHCGQFEHEYEDHAYEPSFNEVAYLYERLKGLVIIKRLKDCVELPTKTYRKITCKPSASTLRVAQALTQSAPNTITGLTLLRELSDGFQYREVQDGVTTCPHCGGSKTVEEWFDAEDQTYQAVDMLDKEFVASLEKRTVACPRCAGLGEVPKKVRVTKEVPCPKDKVLRELLDECEETGRIVIFAGFTGSLDRVANLCRKEGWDVVRCDGRGWLVMKSDGTVVTDEEALDYWANLEEHQHVAFVSQPESGGMSLTLRESRMVVFWSNSFKTEYRVQAEARIQSIGKDNPGLLIVDLFHLPTDKRVLDVIREDRKLELLTMGEVTEGVSWESTEDGDVTIEEATE
jgi:SNF2 family DNA or RNA helicase